MQDSIISQEIANLDLNKVAALQQKRTLAFVNHFVISTVQFLNNFSKQCEQKLMQFERKLEKINATMVLLEARLSSIPEVNTEVVNRSENETVDAVVKEKQEISEIENEQKEETPIETESNVSKVKPEYERFVKMVQVGVPKEAVKLKMSREGLDPSEFDKMLS